MREEERKVVLDVETTGLDIEEGHKIIEVGCVVIKNRHITQETFHYYINPEREIEKEALKVHGIDEKFLKDKPKFSEIVNELCEFVKGSEVIIHNAPFDVGFINHEMQLVNSSLGKLTDYCEVFDTLVLARKLHPGQRNSLDALCKRYNVDATNRILHGGLLDAELLARVYLAMTGGQSVLFQESIEPDKIHSATVTSGIINIERKITPVIYASEEEKLAHEKFLELLNKESKQQIVWLKEKTEQE